MAFTSGWLTLVGGIGPRPLLTRTAAWGQERLECSPRTLRHRWGVRPMLAPSAASPSVRASPYSMGLLCDTDTCAVPAVRRADRQGRSRTCAPTKKGLTV